ncbi:MAG: SMP-30/gluconolactonase/LRE family protein [Chromatiales bacterium]|jgi:gluconolactonase|nr:SMP-30/gluconolactonase/LRE family protein [Chromatiales bacterium]
MFTAPKELVAREFARVPDSLRRHGEPSWMSRSGRVGTFIEGPAFDRAGNLYIVDMPFGRIFRITPEGRFDVVAEYDGAPNGLTIHADGDLYVADRRNGIVRIDPASGDAQTILGELPNAPLKGTNDLVFDCEGHLYFTDQGGTGLHDPTGRLVRLGNDGTVDVLLDNAPSPNGLAFDIAERALFLAVTRANAIWHVPLARDHKRVGRVGLYLQMSGGPEGGPDGLAVDGTNRLCIAHARMGCAWVLSPLGEPAFRIRVPGGNLVTNLAFGGADDRTLYITESETGSIWTAQLPDPGQPLYSHS